MSRTSKIDSRIRPSPRVVSHRPMVELLEDRLPPGDVLLGWGLLGSRLGQVTELGANAQIAMNGQAEARFGHDTAAQSNTLIVAQSKPSGSALPFDTTLNPWQEERNRALPHSGRPEQRDMEQKRSAYRDPSGLDDDLVDRLIADDFAADLAVLWPAAISHKRGIGDFENRAGSTAAAGSNAEAGGAGTASGGVAGSSPGSFADLLNFAGGNGLVGLQGTTGTATNLLGDTTGLRSADAGLSAAGLIPSSSLTAASTNIIGGL